MKLSVQIKTKYELGDVLHMTDISNLDSIFASKVILSKNKLAVQSKSYSDISNEVTTNQFFTELFENNIVFTDHAHDTVNLLSVYDSEQKNEQKLWVGLFLVTQSFFETKISFFATLIRFSIALSNFCAALTVIATSSSIFSPFLLVLLLHTVV